ncbi:MAG TPA: aminotransferase class V-fold PLP-dependent enzyme [Rhizomicrobium sp.]|nr:aminotransferase class V-fold PLP-dependent enzyme [Rhizomicrobium sp.]
MTDISRRHLIQTAASLAAIASAEPAVAQGAKNSNAIRAKMGLGSDIIYVNAANLCPTFKSASAAEKASSLELQADPSQEYRQRFVDISTQLRTRFAHQVNASPDAISLTRNSSESSGNIVRGVPLQAGDEVIIGRENHPSNTTYWHRREKEQGIVVKVANPADEPKNGQDVLDAYLSLATPKTKVIALSHMTNIAGLIAPASEIGRFARSKNIWFHLDCAQTFGWMKLDVAALGCDSFSGSTHKWMMGPLGGGVLYVRPERQGELDPLIMSVNYYRSAKPNEVNGQNFEFIGQRTDPMLPGLMVALDERDAIGADNIERIARANAAAMRQKLQAKGIKVWGSGDSALWGPCLAVVVNDVPGKHKELYQTHKVACAATRVNGQPALRISPHAYNTPEELDRLATLVAA